MADSKTPIPAKSSPAKPLSKPRRKRSRVSAKSLLGVSVVLPLLANKVVELLAPPLSEPLSGEIGTYEWSEGPVHYVTKGTGTPLLLLHGIGFGASSLEWRMNFDVLSEQFTVYAPDLPGFGRSASRSMQFSADLYARFITDFAREVVQRPMDAVGCSLSGAFLIRAAHTAPDMFQRIALIGPTGLEALKGGPSPLRGFTQGLLSIPLFGCSVVNLIGSRASIRRYLEERIYVNRALVTPQLVDQYYAMGHRPHARWAVQAFVSGMLNCDVRNAYPRLRQPLLIMWGERARATPVRQARLFAKLNDRAAVETFEVSGLLPHDEEPARFNSTLSYFLRSALPTTVQSP